MIYLYFILGVFCWFSFGLYINGIICRVLHDNLSELEFTSIIWGIITLSFLWPISLLVFIYLYIEKHINVHWFSKFLYKVFNFGQKRH